MLNTHNFDISLQHKYMPMVMNLAKNRLQLLEILEMVWSVLRIIFKTNSMTPDYFYFLNLILSFYTCSQSLKKKIWVGRFWAGRSLNEVRITLHYPFNRRVKHIPCILVLIIVYTFCCFFFLYPPDESLSSG